MVLTAPLGIFLPFAAFVSAPTARYKPLTKQENCDSFYINIICYEDIV